VIVQLHAQKSAKEAEHKKLSEKFQKLKSSYDDSEQKLVEQEELLQTLTTGLSTANSKKKDNAASAGGYMGRIAAAKDLSTQLQSSIGQAQVRINHLEKELKETEPESKKAMKDSEGSRKKLESVRSEVKKLESELEKLGWSEEAEASNSDRKDKINQAWREALEVRYISKFLNDCW
jgi:structural maintenance of chromosome 2